ncbi:MAG: hypothetical protein WA871_13360 [Candidatus Acidiferrales bacterium]
MKKVIETISGSGTITRSGLQESRATDYQLEVFQEFIENGVGGPLAGLKEIHGRLNPPPPWPLGVDPLVLRLADGRQLKCLLRDCDGSVTGTGGFY